MQHVLAGSQGTHLICVKKKGYAFERGSLIAAGTEALPLVRATTGVAASSCIVAHLTAAGAWIAGAVAARFVVACTAAVLATADAADTGNAVARRAADRGDGGCTVFAEYRLRRRCRRW